MSESLGKWITDKWVDLGNYSDGAKTAIGYRQFKVSIKLDKKNWQLIRAMLLGESPKAWSKMLDLTVDVWGGAGPDYCTQPV